MDGIKTYNNLQKIPDFDFQGYVWYSDKEEPEVLVSARKFDFSTVGTNPFIQEALLFCEDTKTSVMIRHTGSYQISEFDLKKLEQQGAVLSEEKQYYPHRLGFNDKKVCIQQLWLPEPDTNCEGMEVLTLKAHIFTGFKELEK